MISHPALEKIAVQEAQRLFEAAVEGKTRVAPGPRAGDWDAMLRRHVYSQSMVAWRKFGQASIVVSERGRILAFQDDNRLKAEEYEALPPPEVLDICRTTGLLAVSATIVRLDKTPTNLLLAVIEQRHYELPRRLQVLVNTKLRLVAALQVLEEAA